MKKAIALALWTLASAAGCAHASLTTQPFALEWRSSDPDITAPDALRARPIRLEPVADRRADPYHIGSEAGSPGTVRTPGNVAAFVTEQIGHMAQEAGLSLVTQGEAIVLHVELLEFDVTEDSTFNATVRLRVVAVMHTPSGDAAAWDATYEGTTHKWGRTHSADAANEALDDALTDAVKHAIEDPGLAAAVAQATPATSGGAVMGAPVIAVPQPPPG